VNNAINHGVLAPLGVAEAKEAGKSIFFLLESNPGPGLGLLVAYAPFGKGPAKTSAPGAIVIQFFGGIQELYFPYVLMNPLTMVAVAAGGLTGDAVFVAMRAGLVATPSPGSILAEIAMTPKEGLLPILLGIGAAACVSFLVAAPLVGRAGAAAAPALELNATWEVSTPVTQSVLFVCEAGLGSSVMGQSVLGRKLRQAGIDVAVDHTALSSLPLRPGVVVVHRSLAARVRELAPTAEIYAVDEFISTPVYDELIRRLSGMGVRG
jgi:mannitol PTS system EIICBA or EIICB component